MSPTERIPGASSPRQSRSGTFSVPVKSATVFPRREKGLCRYGPVQRGLHSFNSPRLVRTRNMREPCTCTFSDVLRVYRTVELLEAE